MKCKIKVILLCIYFLVSLFVFHSCVKWGWSTSRHVIFMPRRNVHCWRVLNNYCTRIRNCLFIVNEITILIFLIIWSKQFLKIDNSYVFFFYLYIAYYFFFKCIYFISFLLFSFSYAFHTFHHRTWLRILAQIEKQIILHILLHCLSDLRMSFVFTITRRKL